MLHDAMIKGGLTKKLQPLDLTVNRSFKHELRKLWESYMYENVVNLGLEKVKKPSYEIISDWVEKAWSKVSVNCIVNGFRKAQNYEYDSDTEIDSDYELEMDIDSPVCSQNIEKTCELFERFNIISDDEFEGFSTDYDTE